MDKRRNNGGHSTKGFAGRKPLSYEKTIRQEIDKALGKAGMMQIWKALIKEAKAGSIAHQNTLLAYYHGKPKETKNLDGAVDIIVRHE